MRVEWIQSRTGRRSCFDPTPTLPRSAISKPNVVYSRHPMDNFDYPENARRQDAEERFKLGRLAVKEGKLDEAREYLLRAVELDEQNSDAWLWLSATTKDIQEQKKYLEWALAANPGNPEA